MLEIQLTPPAGLVALPELLAATIPEIVRAMHNEIIVQAQRDLGPQTSREYVQSVTLTEYPLSATKILRGGVVPVASVALVGWLPNAIENGISQFDMKPGLLRGRNAKASKEGGMYNTVPFRHGTPGSTGHAGSPMGSAEQRSGMSPAAAKQLGTTIHNAAKRLSATTTHASSGRTQWGARLPAGVGGAKKLKPIHTTDIYAGMVRQEKTYKLATQSQYSTFRRVSTSSASAKWIHPGIRPHKFFEAAAKRIPRIADRIFANALSGMR